MGGGTETILLPQPFPTTDSPVAPHPSKFLAPFLRKNPLPTNAFWQNFILNQGSAPEYIHPYSIKAEDGGLSICYPSRVVQPNCISQAFVPDLTVKTRSGKHVVSHFDDLSVTLEFPGTGMSVPLVRGCPYTTFVFSDSSLLQFSTRHIVQKLVPNEDRTKHRVTFINGQTWLIYSSEPIELSQNLQGSRNFEGVIRVALLPSNNSEAEDILDRFSSAAYPIQGHANMSGSFELTYVWKKSGQGELLMLSLPMHRDIMSSPSTDNTLPALAYKSMDGDMHGVVGDSWVLKETPTSVGWYSSKGISDQVHRNTVAKALRKEVRELTLTEITTDSSYFYGKAVARAARMALIAEEVGALDLLEMIRYFLIDSLTPWMDGKFKANAFLYDSKWGGLTSRNGSKNGQADYGFGLYNDHHIHLGYFCYAGAVLTKLDPRWGMEYMAHLYTMVEDYMSFHHYNHHVCVHDHDQHTHHEHTMVSRSEPLFPRFRNFDFWVLHSWAAGLTEFVDGRNQESTSEAVNAYYSAALLGLAFGDSSLVNAGLTLAALEIRAARALWHIPSDSRLYEQSFVSTHRMVGVLWANKRDTGLWFTPSEWKERRLGIQVLPILPITEILFRDVRFVIELVKWARPSLRRPGVGDGWKGFVYALQALYAPEEALKNVKALSGHDDGNSLSNMLWWIYSRWPREQGGWVLSHFE